MATMTISFLLSSVGWGYIPPPVSYVITSLAGKNLKQESKHVQKRRGGRRGQQLYDTIVRPEIKSILIGGQADYKCSLIVGL